MAIADELRPYLQSRGRSLRGLDVLSVEKQLAFTLYFLKDQGSLSMTANAFGIAFFTVSMIYVRKVCDVIATVLGPMYIKLPSTEQEMKNLVKSVRNKYGFPQAFGCVDGTQFAISLPTENPHDYFSYKHIEIYIEYTSSV